MNKQESYKTYMTLMISSDGNQNVFFISARYRSPFLSGFWFAAIGLPNIGIASKSSYPFCIFFILEELGS